MVEKLKKKEEPEIEVRCGGMALFVDFSKLKKEDFPHTGFNEMNLQDQVAIPTSDGKLYVNRNLIYVEQFLIPVLEIITNHTQKNITQFEKMYQGKFKGLSISNLKDFIKNNNDQNIVEAIYYLLIPAEKARRTIKTRSKIFSSSI